jgi:mono/diheme cytochrome c family protein
MARMQKVLVLLLALLALAVAGCGGGEETQPTPATVDTETATETETEEETGETEPGGEGDPEAGRTVFGDAGCGDCHVLEEAGSTGTIGPNLDEAQPSFDEALEQIRNGGGGMPAFEGQLSEEEIQNVTAFVVEASGGE